MNRASRRASLAEFRHDAARVSVSTFLIDGTDAALMREPFFQAIQHWRGNIVSRKPKCISCRKPFAAADVAVGGWLFAQPECTNAISISAFCSSCWSSLDDKELERCAVRTLRAIKPNSRFADAS